jgi:hypothetical protein
MACNRDIFTFTFPFTFTVILVMKRPTVGLLSQRPTAILLTERPAVDLLAKRQWAWRWSALLFTIVLTCITWERFTLVKLFVDLGKGRISVSLFLIYILIGENQRHFSGLNGGGTIVP